MQQMNTRNEHFWNIMPEKGERILWQGTPQRHCVVARLWFCFIAPALIGPLLLWSFTGPVPDGAAGFHAWASHGFCRTIMFILVVAHAALPFLYARITNASSYVVTDRRLVIRKPWIGSGHYTESYPYGSICGGSVKPLGEGLGSFHFEGYSKGKHESSHEILYAIPAAVAHDVELLFRRAHSVQPKG